MKFLYKANIVGKVRKTIGFIEFYKREEDNLVISNGESMTRLFYD
ncbi:hypothetical protein [Shewanella sp. SG41-4]|nr:hypothetical protein [Shewanella sp. SG41-4]